MIIFLLHVTCSCIPIHTFFLFNIFWYIWTAWDFFYCFFLPLSLLFYVSLLLWHPNTNLLCPRTLFVPGHPLLPIILPHTSDSVMRRPNRTSLRTFPDKAFILNAKSSCQTSLTLTFPLSFIVRNGSHYVTSRSHVHLCWSRSFTLTCMDLIFRYLSSLLVFEGRALLSHRRLSPMYFVSPG